MEVISSDDEIDILNVDPHDNILEKLKNLKTNYIINNEEKNEDCESTTDSEDETIDVVNDGLIEHKDLISNKKEINNKTTNVSQDNHCQISNNKDNVREDSRAPKIKITDGNNQILRNTDLKQRLKNTPHSLTKKLSKKSKENLTTQKQMTLLNFFSKLNNSLKNVEKCTVSNSSEVKNLLDSNKIISDSITFNKKTSNVVEITKLPTAKIVLQRVNINNYAKNKVILHKKILSKSNKNDIFSTNKQNISAKNGNEMKAMKNVVKSKSEPKNKANFLNFTILCCSKCNKVKKVKSYKKVKCETCLIYFNYKCTFCENICTSLNGMYKHAKNKHLNKNAKKIKDKINKSTFSASKKKKKAFNRQTEIKSFIAQYCPNCNKRSETCNYQKQKCESCLIDKNFTCLLCQQNSESINIIYKHVKKNHCDHLQDIGKLFEINKDLKEVFMNCKKCKETHNLVGQTTNICSKCKSKMVFICQKCKNQFETLHGTLRHVRYLCKGMVNIYYCNDCDYKHQYKSSLQLHIMEKHMPLKEILYECKTCHHTYKGKYNMRKHQSTCGIPPHLCCKFCSYKIKHYAHIKRHLKSKHMDQIGSATNFDSIFEDIIKKGKILKAKAIKSLNDGTQPIVKSDKTFSALTRVKRYCSKCDEIYESEGNVNKKICPKCTTPFYFQCIKCDLRNKNYNVIYNHITLKCYPKQIFTCDHCQFVTTNKPTIARHIYSKHVIIDSNDFNKCLKCGKAFKVLSDLKSHIKYCGSNHYFKCKFCQYKTKYKNSFGRHMHNHLLLLKNNNEDINNEIEISKAKNLENCTTISNTTKNNIECNSSCKTVDKTIITKKKIVLENRNYYECSKCSKEFTCKQALQKHQKYTCFNEASIQCEHCPHKSKNKWNMLRHVENIHTISKKVKCKYCKNVFKNKNCLKSHQFYCNKERKYKCEHCDYKTHYKYSLALHLKLNHVQLFTDRELQCSVCNKQITNIFLLEKHIANCRKD